ncbi:hypothetical protein JCM5350_007230 [Sporobolomyces pararoseus]
MHLILSEEALLKDISQLVSSFEASATSIQNPQGLLLPTSISELPREILLRIAELIKIPQEFGFDTNDGDEEEETGDSGPPRSKLERSDSFKSSTTALLDLSVQLVRLLPSTSDSEPPERNILDSEATLFVAFSKFFQPDFSTLFTTTESKKSASQTISLLLCDSVSSSKRLSLLTHLLRTALPIHFKPNPKLNPSTGRVLNRPLGGPSGIDDWNEESDQDGVRGWKREIGLSGTILTILQNLKVEELEDLWPWLLPPILSYLEDFNPLNKILGLHLLDSLLNLFTEKKSEGNSSSTLLVRTGVGKVFKQSLSVIFSNLSDPLSIQLQSLSQPISLKLLNLLHPRLPLPPTSLSSTTSEAEKKKRRESSLERFEALCLHFQETVLKIWQYKPDHYEFEFLLLSENCGVLPWIKESFEQDESGMGGGGAEVIRYLGILIPHLVGIVKGDDLEEGNGVGVGVWNEKLIKLRLRAIIVLKEMLRNNNQLVKDRVRKNWEDSIVTSLAKCWIGFKEDGEVDKMRNGGTNGEEEDNKELVKDFERQLKELVKTLREGDGGRVDGEVGRRDYWKELRELDPVFEELVM